MKITTRFGLGDRVYVITCGDVYKDEPCRTCSEAGRIDLSGESFVCPKCLGRKMEKRTSRRWHFSQSFSVGYLRADVTSALASHDADTDEFQASYMEATSGTVWSGTDCFASREEADEAAAKRNENIGEFAYTERGRVLESRAECIETPREVKR